MKKISLLLTVIMTISVLSGCNLSNNETKDIKNKEEISYSKNDESKDKKETNTASETVKKFEEKSITLNEEDKRILSMLIGEICDFKIGRVVSKNENIIPTTDKEKLRLLWIMFCDGWLRPVIDFNDYKIDNSYSKIAIPEKDVNKMLKDAFDSKDITIKDQSDGLRYVNGNYELSLANRGDEYIATDITKVTQISETQVKIEGITKLVSGFDGSINYLENFKAIAKINKDSMFGGYTLISLECWDANKESDTNTLQNNNQNSNQNISSENISYLKYGNARFGFIIDYPDFLTEARESMNGDGVTLTNPENTVCLKAYGLNNVLSQTTKDYFESDKESIDVDIAYEALFDNSYILSWEDNGLIYYKYTVVGTGCYNGFYISYPKEEKEKFDEIVSTIYNSFKTGDLTEAHGPIMNYN